MDQDDRLVQVSKGVYASGAVLENEFTVEYSYDSMGRMLRRDNGSEVTTFVWDGWDLLSEETDSVVTTYLVPDGLVWSFVRGEDVFQVHSDALGSVRVVTDSEGEVVARFEYGAWGELLPGSFDSVGLALRFVGGLGVRTDLEAGLYYMRHRWYNAELQRFISGDPIGLRGGSNAYVYADNRPISKIDPNGLSPLDDAITGLQQQIGSAIAQQAHGLGTSPILNALNNVGITAQDYLDALGGGDWSAIDAGTPPAPGKLAENLTTIGLDGKVTGRAEFYTKAENFPASQERIQALVMHEVLHHLLFKRQIEVMLTHASFLVNNGCDLEQCMIRIKAIFTHLGYRKKHLRSYFDPLGQVYSVGMEHIDSDEITVTEMNTIAEYVCKKAHAR